MIRAFVDTAVLVYAVGGEHPLREPSRRVLELARDGRLRAETSVAVLQELLHVRARRLGRPHAISVVAAVAAAFHVHDLRADDAELALALFAAHPDLDAQDAFHAALAINRGLTDVVSPDRGFESIPGLRRIDPVDLPTVLAAP